MELISSPPEAELPAGSSSMLVKNPKALQRTLKCVDVSEGDASVPVLMKLVNCENYPEISLSCRLTRKTQKTDWGSELIKMLKKGGTRHI